MTQTELLRKWSATHTSEFHTTEWVNKFEPLGAIHKQ